MCRAMTAVLLKYSLELAVDWQMKRYRYKQSAEFFSQTTVVLQVDRSIPLNSSCGASLLCEVLGTQGWVGPRGTCLLMRTTLECNAILILLMFLKLLMGFTVLSMHSDKQQPLVCGGKMGIIMYQAHVPPLEHPADIWMFNLVLKQVLEETLILPSGGPWSNGA